MQRKKSKSVGKDLDYKLRDGERDAINKQIERLKEKPAAPRLKVKDNGDGEKVWLDHPDEFVASGLLNEALGTASFEFSEGLIGQLVKAATHDGKINVGELNFMLSVVKDIRPRDQLEAMLGAQMAAVHVTSMKFARQFSLVENLPHQDSVERAFNKLVRTFTTQMEALKRYRTGGEQKVTVQHVSVSEGGQAIVGNVTQAAREATQQSGAYKTTALTDARRPAMPIIDKSDREPVKLRRKRENDGRSST